MLVLDEAELGWAAFLKARQVAEDSGARPILWQVLWELSQLATAVGNASAADGFRQQAQEIITYIAGHTGSEELRVSFLSMPEVKSVLNKLGIHE